MIGFWGPTAIILMVFGPYSPIVWILGPLGIMWAKSRFGKSCRCVRGACNFAQAMAFPHGAVVGFRVWGLGFWVLGSGELSHCSKKV